MAPDVPRETSDLGGMAEISPPGCPLPRDVDEVLASAPRGFPRPITDGLPTPWVANTGDLGDINAFRRAIAVMNHLCQVCGEELGATATVYWCPGDLFVIDGAAVHPDRCASLAERHCPALRKKHDAGMLRIATVLTAALMPVETNQFCIDEGMPCAYLVPTR